MPKFAILLALAGLAAAQPIRLHPDNPHYYEFRGKPFLAVTSAEHYGALINRDFDFRKYHDAMQKDGMRLTRFFTGFYRESPTSFNIAQNTLAPTADRFLTPYSRTSTPGALDGLNKWDLSKWNPEYWQRLTEIVTHANERGIVIQVVLFCTYYRDFMWEASPLHAKNNINGTPDVPRGEVLTLQHPALYKHQDDFVRKIVTELNRFDNVTWEICNEPYFGVAMDWQLHMAQLIRDVEAKLEKRHLVARNVANHTEQVVDPSPNIDILHFHYARPPVAVAMNYGLKRLIGFDETGFDGTLDAPYRIQAWDFVLAGGGHYNHLDYSFTVGHEDGTYQFPKTQPGGGGPELRRSLKALIDFMERFDFIRMEPANKLITGGVPEEASAGMLAGEKEYALYLHHGRVFSGYSPQYIVKRSPQNASIVLNLPAGRYRSVWWHPASGKQEEAVITEHAGGPLWLTTPEYREDLALELRRE